MHNTEYVSVPREVAEWNKIVMLAADVFFVDGTAFLLRVLRQIKFILAEHVATHKAKSLSKHLTWVVQIYAWTGFIVRTILMDGKFGESERQITIFNMQHNCS